MSKWRPKDLNCLYAIGDVHGKLHQLNLIFNRIMPLRKSDGGTDRLVMLGDYIDRGHDSDKIIDLLIKLKKKFGDQLILLRGNHELMFLKSMFDTNSDTYRMWMPNGGEQTLLSYLRRAGLDIKNPYVFERKRIPDIVPLEHLEFLTDLQNYYVEGDFIFAHAGWDPILKPEQQSEESLLWGNNIWGTARQLTFGGKPLPWDKTIVIGHWWRGPWVTDKFMMLDSSYSNEIILMEVNSRQAFSARPKKLRLVKIPIKNQGKRKGLFTRSD